ncbi:MAG: glycosyltransferase [Nostoc sp. ChiSLP02]|nr:glycosyltransferase [Nostoc sp. DedSLP05]MDZ8102286.1 glycosyltransferase [Nostoc sp. DedSLP01]MDZ8187291.1 glycosyltransferase [Nostoc sp. ChiSLP02]
MKILFLTTILLSQNRNGGEVATQCFLDGLKHQGHEVTVVGYLRKGDRLDKKSQDTIIVAERNIETRKAKINSLYWFLLSLLKGMPYSAAKYYSGVYINILKKSLLTEEYDLIVIDHPQLAWLSRFLRQEDKCITISHNIEHQMYEEICRNANSFISKSIYGREARLIKAEEHKLAIKAKQIWTLTENDAKYFTNINGAAKTIAFTLPPTSEKLLDKPLSKNFDIGLLGSWSWKSNLEALQWFLESVYPYLPTNLSIHIAGKGADWLTSKYPNINYCGVVPDAQEFMAQARVIAIPTLSGGGIQIKTLDAIASGASIVATPVALRGISDPPSTVQIAENPEEFANFLLSAVSLSFTHKAFEEAKNWYHLRQDKFIHDIAAAIDNL